MAAYGWEPSRASLELDRSRPDLKRTAEILEWVYGSGSDVAVSENEDGTLETDRPETAEKFRVFFAESRLKSFYGIVLKDEEGPLGVLGFESAERLVFDEETRSLLQILVNQATVAVRNAQLYRQVPLVGFLQPSSRAAEEAPGGPAARRITWGLGALGAPRRSLPRPVAIPAHGRGPHPAGAAGRRDGRRGRHRRPRPQAEGDVRQGRRRHRDARRRELPAAAAAARTAYDIAERPRARASRRERGRAFEAESRRKELAARIALENERVARTRLVAPVSGVIVTPRIQERVGQSLARGAELCVIADVATVTVEVAFPKTTPPGSRPANPRRLKVHAYPTRTFAGPSSRVGALVREEGRTASSWPRSTLDNHDGSLKTGMLEAREDPRGDGAASRRFSSGDRRAGSTASSGRVLP